MATPSIKKVSLLEGGSGLTPARKTPPLDTSLLGHGSQHAFIEARGTEEVGTTSGLIIRNATAVEIALSIPPGKSRMPKGVFAAFLVSQPAQSPDLNVNDLGFLASVKSRVWGMNVSSIDEVLVEIIFQQHEEYDGETLERVWQRLCKVYNRTLRKMGDNDFKVEHTGVKRQRAGTLEKVSKYYQEAFSKA